MRVRIFMDPAPAVVENAEIIKTETTGVVAAPAQDGRSYPYIIVTIWFERR